MKTYVTFGHGHRHIINSVVFDRDCVAVVDGNREKVHELFGVVFCTTYTDLDSVRIEYYPRGLIEVPKLKDELEMRRIN